MDSINFLLIFDIIIFGYGICIVSGAVKMNRTKVPASMLIPQEDLVGSKDPKGFCDAMYKKTLFFGILCVLFGAASGMGEIYIKSRIFNAVLLTVFLIAVLWYCREMRSARYTYIR